MRRNCYCLPLLPYRHSQCLSRWDIFNIQMNKKCLLLSFTIKLQLNFRSIVQDFIAAIMWFSNMLALILRALVFVILLNRKVEGNF